MVAQHLNIKPGRFTWSPYNVQIYTRHINQAIELLNRDPVDCKPHLEHNPEIKDFYDFEVDDIKLIDYPRKEIAEKNKKLTFEIAV